MYFCTRFTSTTVQTLTPFARQPAPSPDDLDYVEKMQEKQEKALRNVNGWPDAPPVSEYRVSHIYRPPTPEEEEEEGGEEEEERDAAAQREREQGEELERARAREAPGGGIAAAAASAAAAAAAAAQQEGRADVGGLTKRVAVPREAWVDVGGGGGEGAGEWSVACGPDDEVLIILDGARFLPDNVGVTSATISLRKSDGTPVSVATAAAGATGSPGFLALRVQKYKC